jgi:3-methyladenine DNA glycosylase AlkD
MHLFKDPEIMAKSTVSKNKIISNKKPTKTSSGSAPIVALSPANELTAKNFINQMNRFQSNAEREKIQRYFKTGEGEYGAGDTFMGIRMGQLFALAKSFVEMPILELDRLLDSDVHEVRAGALSIMDKKARNKKLSQHSRKQLFDLYMDRIDRINNWDLVDVSAIYVVGAYLYDKPRSILYKLARSKNMWARRTAIVSTAYFLKHNDSDDTFSIAEILLKDKEDLIHKAVGGWIRQAGKADRKKLLTFLDEHAPVMPRTMLRYAIEHLDKKQREHYLNLK